MHVTIDYLIRYIRLYVLFEISFCVFLSIFFLHLRYSITILNYYFRLVEIIMGF